jgi:hypothetical protein
MATESQAFSGDIKMSMESPIRNFALAAVKNKETLVRQGESFMASAQTEILRPIMNVSQGSAGETFKCRSDL